MKPSLFRLTLFSLLVACLVACTPTTSHNLPATILVLNIGAEPTVLNPILYTDVPSGEVVGQVFSGLFKVNEDLKMRPDLCQSYEVSKDSKRYVFHLKKNVKWHDGKPFTAEDVKFTFDLILNPKTNTVRRSNFIVAGKPIEFRVIDTHTIEAILPKPYAPFLVEVAIEILPKHLLAGKDVNSAAFNRHPIGTGPFKFVEWKTGQYVRLARNDAFYDGVSKISEILMKIIPDENTAQLALQQQEIDQNGIQAKDFKRFKRLNHLNTYRWYGLNYTYLGFNFKHPLFSQLKIRQAVSYAINKDAIVKGVLEGYGRPAYYPSTPVSWAYPSNQDHPIYPYNPEKSKKLLAELGYVLNPDTKILEKDGKPLEFTLITNKGNKYREKSAEIMQQSLANVGIKMTIQLMEWSAFIKRLNAQKDPKDFDAALLGWSLGIDPDAFTVWHSSEYPKGFNMFGYSNKKVDFLLTQGRSQLDANKRKPLYHDLYREIAQDAPYVFLYNTETLVGVNKRVRGLSKPGPAGLMNDILKVNLVP